MKRILGTALLAVASLVALSIPARADVVCVDDYEVCPDGAVMKLCSSYQEGVGCVTMWYEVHGNSYVCSDGCSTTCVDEAMAAAADCNGRDTGCLKPCGDGCCDGLGECCNGGCLDAGQSCCGLGACEAGFECDVDSCIPEGATDCGDGTFCPTGQCCNGGCLADGETCCASGVCAVGENCVDGLCVASDAVACGDGTWCPAGTACASGKCCPNGFAFFDSQSGYCCGSGGLGSGICECATGCNGWCCPGGTVCCTGGFCAATEDGCPVCPEGASQMCGDHSCVPAGTTCCGNGYYCENGLSCMKCETGDAMCCGTTTTPAGNSGLVLDTSGTVAPESVSSTGEAGAGSPPAAPSDGAVTPTAPVEVEKADGGCSAGTSQGGLPAVIVLLSIAAFGLIIRRSRA